MTSLTAAQLKAREYESVNYINATDIYGDGDLPLRAPDNYEFTGEFRLPNSGEFWLDSEACAVHNYAKVSPRLILRKREPKVRLVEVERRAAQSMLFRGEFYQDLNGSPTVFHVYGESTRSIGPVIVFRREEFYD